MSSEKWLAIGFAVLMVTSLVAMPALAGGPSPSSVDEHYSQQFAAGHSGGGPPGHGNSGPPAGDAGQTGPPGHERGSDALNVTVPELDANSSLETILVATERLEELDWNESESDAEAITETVTAINDSIQAYRQVDHVDNAAAFDSLSDAQAGLEELQTEFEENRSLLESTSADLYDVANASARLEVRDAAFTVEQYEEEFHNPGQRQSAESHLGNALDALERADDALEGDNSDTIEDRTRALNHLETAWGHAQKALDTVEANTDPDLSLSQGHAFEDDGTILVSVSIGVSDVRSYNYDEATVTVETADGETRTEQVSLYAPETSGATATGMTTVDVGEDAGNATVTVSATATHDDERSVEEALEIVVDEDDVIPELPDPDEYTEVEVEDDDSGVTVDAGGDGLHETHLEVTDRTPDTDDAYRAGPMVRIENTRAIDEATVTIPVDDADLEREGNLSVVTWDPHSDEPWVPVETEIDREAGTATAEVGSFSYFSVFHIDAWTDATSDTMVLDEDHIVEEVDGFDLADLLFVVDLGDDQSAEQLDETTEAANVLVDALATEDRAGLVSYGHNASLKAQLTTEHEVVQEEIDGLEATNGSADLGAGLRTGIDELETNGLFDTRELIVLSSGEESNASDSMAAAEEAAANDIRINTLAVGESPETERLEEIAATTDGDFARITDASDLPRDLLGPSGQDGWTNESDWDLSSGCSFQEDVVLEGNESMFCTNVETAIYESTSIDTDGEYTVAGAYITDRESVGAGIRWGLGSGNDVDLGVRITDDGLEWRHTDDSDPTIETNVSRDTWVRFEIAWDNGEMKYREWEPGDTRPEWQANTTAFDQMESQFTISTGTGACCGREIYFDGFSEDVILDRVGERDVTLRDSNGDGIPDAVAELNLSMPAGTGDVVGEPLDLDPIALDTSGDGILDNETVDIEYRVFEEDGETKVEAKVTNAEHHPARVDTTGDGLTDREQLEDGWEIAYTNSREDSLEVLSALEEADDLEHLEDVDEVFETPRVYANPLVNDTSGDGLSDLEEVEELGTDPESTDTTGDGVPDAEAEDPTLFDISSPELTITSAEFDDPSAEVSVSVGWDGVSIDTELDTTGTYEAQFIAEDQAGLGEARLVQDGEVKDTTYLSGTWDSGILSFETGTLSTFADLFEGTTVTVQVDDRHGPLEEVGTTEAEAITVNGIFSQVSQELRAAGYTNAEAEEALGLLEGMTTGAGETLGGILAIYDDPHVIVEAARAIPESVENFDEIIEAMPESIEQQQKFNNPHDPGDQYYEEFRYGWYQGYFFWFVVEMAVPAGEANKALKSTDTVQSTADRISTPQVQRAAQLAKQGGQTATAPVRYSRQQLSQAAVSTFSLTEEAANRLLGPGRSTGKQVDNAQTAARLDDQTVRIIADGSGDTAESFRRAVYRAADDDGVSYGQIDRAVRTIDDLEGPAKTRAERLVRETDGDGLRLIDELDGDSLQRVLNLDIDQAHEFRLAAAQKHGQGLADVDDIDAFARHADNLQSVDGLNSGPVEDFITAGDSGNVQGAIREVRRADEIGAENIQRMNLEVYDGKQRVGELDIQRTNGEIVESKSSFGYDPDVVDREFENKLTTMREHGDVDLDGNTLEVRATHIGDQDIVKSSIQKWESELVGSGEWNNADVTVKVVDESTDTVIEG